MDVLVDSNLVGRHGPRRRLAQQKTVGQIPVSRPATTKHRFGDVFDPKPMGPSVAV